MSLANQSIDRKLQINIPSTLNVTVKSPLYAPRASKKRLVEEDIPIEVEEMVVEEVLKDVGGRDWNDPLQISRLIAEVLSLDIEQPLERQVARIIDKDKTVVVPYKRKENESLPVWVLQSFILVDESRRYVDYNGGKYNKIDIILQGSHFKQRLDEVASHAGCAWNARWGASRDPQHRLYQKTRPFDDSWVERCVKPLLRPGERINIKNIMMIEFKRIV